MTAILVYDATLERLEEWLHALAALAAREQGRNPLRPQPAALIPCRAEIAHLPVYVRPVDGVPLAIYEHLPSVESPFGRPLLLLAVHMRSAVSMHVIVRREPGFPLTIREVRWFFLQGFPSQQCTDLQERRIFQLQDLPLNPLDAPPPVAHRCTLAARGAPMLPCNRWLMDRLRVLPNRRAYHHLYAEWLKRYVAIRGHPPSDPTRSFRAAVAGCLRRLAREEGESE